ncbi:phosphotransferase [Oligoflexia bacterium]|nr:phosphotransferase [Oligoflexia bacterium]
MLQHESSIGVNRNEIVLDIIRSEWDLRTAEVTDSSQTFLTRTVLTIHSDRGFFAAKVDCDPSPDKATSAVLLFLKERAFRHSPEIFPTADGRYSITHDSMDISLFEYIPEELSGAEGWAGLGEAVATLNQICDFPSPYVVNPHGAINELVEWCHGKNFEHDFRAILADIAHEVSKSSNIGLIHGEVNLANARRRTNGEVVLLDWDEAGYAPVELELGYPLITSFIDETSLRFDVGSAHKFYEAYAASGTSLSLIQESIWQFGLLHALRSVTFFNTEARWKRVLKAIEIQDDLIAVLS